MAKLLTRILTVWEKQPNWLTLLRPLSWLYRVGFTVNQWLYQNGYRYIYHSPVPVMVVGNITVGGSGKTPLIITLVHYLQAQGVRVGVISRGYGGAGPFPALVTPESDPDLVGDEPCLIVQETHVPFAVAPNRQQAIELLLDYYRVDIILIDDGLQHFALARDIEWIVIDGARGFGNQRLLPEGFLREPLSRLLTSTVIEHDPEPCMALHMHLKALRLYPIIPREHVQFDANLAHAVAGIGYPQRFYHSLRGLGINVIEHDMPDHHRYSLDDLIFDDQLPIIVTSKDAIKIKPLLANHLDIACRVWVLPVEAILSDACFQTLKLQLQQLKIDVI